MEIHQHFLTQNDCYKANKWITPKGIMIHSTGANNPNLHRYVDTKDGYTGTNRNGNDWDRPGVGACVHAFIGLKADGTVGIVQTLPWTMRGWHCGRSGNDTHISIEICEDGLTDRRYLDDCLDAAAELCAMLCKEYGLDPMKPGVLIDHAEGNALGIASGHADISHWLKEFGLWMPQFRDEVDHLMAEPEDEDETGCGCTALEDRIAELEGKIAKLEANLVTVTKLTESYKTLDDVPDWAKEEIKAMCLSGLVRGDGNGNLNIPRAALQAYLTVGRAYADIKLMVEANKT